MGPIVAPHLVTICMHYNGVRGTVLIFAGIALCAVIASLMFQPAMRHSKHVRNDDCDGGEEGDEQQEQRKPSALEVRLKEMDKIECRHCQRANNRKMPSIFSSQYLYNADDSLATGYEIIDPGTPMLAAANDGWYSVGSGKRSLYGSKWSLTSQRKDQVQDSRKASNQNLVMSNRPSYANLGVLQPVEVAPAAAAEKKKDNRSIKNFKIEEHDAEDCPSQKAPQDLSENEKTMVPRVITFTEPMMKSVVNDDRNNHNNNNNTVAEAKYLLANHSARSLNRNDSFCVSPLNRNLSNTFNREKETLKEASQRLQKYVDGGRTTKPHPTCTCDEERRQFLLVREKEEIMAEEDRVLLEEQQDEGADDIQYTLWQKIVIFFDLDLLKDFSFVNLMIGVTIANFAELNFSILTPFVLGDFGFSKDQTALLMSILAFCDIVVRFCIPFIAGKTGLANRTFFLLGIGGMALGRIGMFLQIMRILVSLFYISLYLYSIPV